MIFLQLCLLVLGLSSLVAFVITFRQAFSTFQPRSWSCLATFVHVFFAFPLFFTVASLSSDSILFNYDLAIIFFLLFYPKLLFKKFVHVKMAILQAYRNIEIRSNDYIIAFYSTRFFTFY